MSRLSVLVFGPALALTAGLIAADGDAPDTKSLALKDALIRTQTEAGDFVGTVLIRDGKIAAVGLQVEVPADATVVDVSRCVITPGLIDAHGTLGLNAAAARESGRDATLSILDAVDPFADDWRDAARQGVTAVYVQPGGSGNLGGGGAVLRVCSGDCADSLSLRSPAGVQIALGTPPRAETPAASPVSEFFRGRGIQLPTQPQTPTPPPPANSLTRFAQYEQVRGQFDGAKKYADSKPAKREPPKELLGKAISKDIPVRIEIHHEDDIRNAVRLAGEFGLRPVFERVERARVIPDELQTSKAPLVIGPLLGTRPSGEVRKLALDGRRFAIGTFGEEPRATVGLRFQAAAAVAAGYPRERVLRALTSDAADLLGAGDQLGRIAAGRPADLVVFAGDPLDPSAPVRLTLSQGKVTHSAPAVEVARAPSTARPDLPEKLPPSYVIKTTRLLNSAGEFSPGELHIVDGRLSGPNGSPAPVIDLGDTPVTPGLVAAHVASAGETAPDADAAHLRGSDGLTADDSRLRACRDAGFLTVVVAPASSNVLAGVCSVVRPGEAAAVSDVSLKVVLTAASRSRERYPVSLAGQVELIDARLRGAPADTNLHLPPAVRTTLLAERDRVLNAVRDRRLTACIEAQTRAEIRTALRLIDQHKLRGVLLMPRDLGGLGDAELADEIRASGVPVIVGPAKPQDAERTTRGLAALGKAGVPLAFAGDAAEPRVSAAWLVNAGLPRSAARRALIGQPGDAFGLPTSTGRLALGDAADFVIWTGDPLDTTSKPAAVVVQGQRVAASAGDDAPVGQGAMPQAPARTGRRGR
jgi:imidazolonepropionase-like amidohydrolase